MGKSLLFSYTLKNANPFSRKSMISWREQSDVRFSLPPNKVQSGNDENSDEWKGNAVFFIQLQRKLGFWKKD